MGQEFFIKSSNLESQVRKLLPSQGGLGAGFDLSASTQIIPIIDLTESAEGSNLRSDLQSAFSFDTCTAFGVNNSSSTIITTTGYFRIICTSRLAGAGTAKISITDGATTKDLISYSGASGVNVMETIDKIFFVGAGDSIIVESTAGTVTLRGSSRQIADIDGNLVNP